MLSLLTQRLALYTYGDTSPDGNYDNAAYTFAMYAWGRVEPRGAAMDKTTAGAAYPHRTALITMRDQITLADFSLVVDPLSQIWRVTGTMPRIMRRLTQYTADYAPQMSSILVSTAFGP